MKQTPTLSNLNIRTPEQGFDYLMETLRPSLKLWDYFVNWEKVFANTRSLEIHLNIWNYLLGKENFASEFLVLLEEHPQIVKAIPALIVRDGAKSKTFQVIRDIENLAAEDEIFDFGIPASTPELRASALRFVQESGLHRLFKDDGVKNLVDYVLGVEAGLDSNGRKNRSGTSMEKVVSSYLRMFCSENNYEFIEQADAVSIRSKWGFNVPVDKSSRRFDFAVSDSKTLVLIEVNFYGGGGSKLKATAGEYKGLFELVSDAGFKFVWVTDGKGWVSSDRPLQEAFNKLDHLWNLKMLNTGCLKDLF
jgi:type II restriction enzyme